MAERKNETEAEERAHLKNVLSCLYAQLEDVGADVHTKYHDMLAMKQYLHESRADMDHAEKISVRQTIEQMSMLGKHRFLRREQLERLVKSPYFARIDFAPQNAPPPQLVYIGIHAFHDPDTDEPYIYDWRAPIASMFYDFEIGPAWYETPDGRVDGELARKRQYRIESGELVFMIESSLQIQDEVLQEELSRSSDAQMRNIVATIQRDQNAIIRNEDATALIIQGAAGSGKTSIALHRIAFLLYRFKDTITSEEMLIISPNEVFAHYIANVLPELGEETIQETTIETLAAHLLEHKVAFESFSTQVSRLLADDDENYGVRIRFKASMEFLHRMDAYITYLRSHNVQVHDILMDRFAVPGSFVQTRFDRCGAMPYNKQVNAVLGNVIDWIKRQHSLDVTREERSGLRKALTSMIRETSLPKLYAGFYDWCEQPDLFVQKKKGFWEYADVFPLLYLKLNLEGVVAHTKIKHLLVDEMQDYSPLQYRVLDMLFPCRKTILGDTHQSVNPFGASTAEDIRAVIPASECMYMHKSYRSTLEISALSQHINRNVDLVPVERHGEPCQILACDSPEDELREIRVHIRIFLDSPHKSLGIITRTQREADELYDVFKGLDDRVILIRPDSTIYRNGVIISTAHLAKGLEFDSVLVPFASEEHYNRPIDRQMLYVACTRAMHELTLTHTGKITRFLEGWDGI
ncbi:MAG: HelD family protein [Kiritimatiellia bacterium]